MPSGDIHFKYFKKGYAVELPLSVVMCAFDWKFGVGNIVGYSFGRWIDPDWDIFGSNNAEGRMVNELPIIGHFLYGVSSIYGSFFRKHHRSVWTHFPAFSTLIRLVYVFIIPFILLDYFGINLIGNGWHMFYLGFWSGLSQADAIHYVLDKTYGD
jgi:hypothetical protein